MTSQPYNLIEHTADTGFEVRGSTRGQVYQAAALAFFDIMWRLDSKEEIEPEIIEITGRDPNELMVNFLEEFLFLYDARGVVCTDLEVTEATETTISARAWLQLFNDLADEELLGVKAVTYHQLYIAREGDEWLARVFLDI